MTTSHSIEDLSIELFYTWEGLYEKGAARKFNAKLVTENEREQWKRLARHVMRMVLEARIDERKNVELGFKTKRLAELKGELNEIKDDK